MNEEQGKKAIAMIMAFFTLDPTKMSMADQFLYLSIMIRFADMIEPLVKQYGGSVEELQKKWDLQTNEQKFKDIASAILVKAMMDQHTDDEDEDEDNDN